MDERLVGSLVFLVAGGILSAVALAIAVSVYRFRQRAVRTVGTVVETWTQAIKAQPLESFYLEDQPRPETPTAKNVYATRTRWIKVACEDGFGEPLVVSRIVYGRYTLGQQVVLLAAPEEPTRFQIDAPLELYGRPLVIAVMGFVFLICGGLIWGNFVPLGSE